MLKLFFIISNVSIDEIIITNSNKNLNNENSLSFCLEGLDADMYKCLHSLCDDDKMNILRYIDYIKKRNKFI